MSIIAGLLSILLAVAPGTWLAFTLLDRSFAYSTRLALAIALSPFVIGAQIILLTFLGLGFNAAASASLLNLAALPLLWMRRPAPAPKLSLEMLAPAACFLALAGGLIALWVLVPNFRVYSWHNMMQVEAVYQVAQLPRAPEEMGLAGVRMHYPWFGHVQVAAVAAITDVSPFKVFPVINIATLLAMFLLLLDTVRRLRPGKLALASVTATAALLSTNLAGILLTYGVNVYDMDHRTSTSVHKFMHFDLMTNGLALFVGVMLLGLMSVERLRARVWAVVVLSLCAVALTYPLLLPSSLLMAGAALAVPPALALLEGKGLRLSRATLIAGAALVTPLLTLVVYLDALSGGLDTQSTITLSSPSAIYHSLRTGFLATVAWAPFLIPVAIRLWKSREPERLTLALAAAGSAGLFVVTTMPLITEYKFIVAAMLCALPLVAEQLMIWLERLGRSALPVGAAAAAAVYLLIAPHIVTVHVPWQMDAAAAPIDETHFRVGPIDHAKFAWTDAVRADTPDDTVVVQPELAYPVAIFAERSTWIAPDDTDSPRPGYSMTARSILGDVKGYPADLIAARDAVQQACYSDDPEADYAGVTAALTSLDRPVAIYFPRANAYLGWLEAHRRGHQIFADAGATVWLVDPAGT